jgi:hypothetical protein
MIVGLCCFSATISGLGGASIYAPLELQHRRRPMILADNLPILRCLCCGNVMKMVRTVPRLGELPGLLVFACSACNEVEVKEEREERRAA